MECNNCRQTDFQDFIKADCFWSKAPLNVVECKNCGLVFLYPRPDKKLGLDYFDKAYSNAEGFKNHTYYRDNELILQRNRQRFEIIKKLDLSNKNILDFGAGQGHFIKVCEENNWTASGVELSLEAIKAAREQFNIDIKSNLDNYKTSSFDVITLWDVIEHLENPREVLLNLRKYLREDGFIIIETSNLNSYNFLLDRKNWAYWHIDHLFYYSDRTLEDLLNDTGFKPIRLSKDLSQMNGKKKQDFKKYLILNNYIRTIKVLYIKSKYKGASKNSLMTIVAKKGSLN